VFYKKSLVPPSCCRKSKASEVTGRGPRKTGKEKAFGDAKARDAGQRWHASCYPKAAASSPAHVSVLLEVL
jgi:hypothetical protein